MKKKTFIEPTASIKSKTLMERMELVPFPEQIKYQNYYFPFPKKISIHGLSPKNEQTRTLQTLREAIGRMPGIRCDVGSNSSFIIRFIRSNSVANPEGYLLSVEKNGVTIKARTAKGEYFGAQTLIQILQCSFFPAIFLGSYPAAEPDALAMKYVPGLEIKDEPRYSVRSFMIDLGRSVFSVPYIKRIIRIVSHLKLNTLHFHLLDDELCGLRFRKLPLGRENPHAISLNDLANLVSYARSYHVGILPEIESWGHVQSVIYHYPELYGASGMWGGSSFGIGEKTYCLLEKIYDEIVPVLEDKTMFHVGLDEALWKTLPGEENQGHTPSNMVLRIYRILQKVARRHKKEVTMHLWADHGGRPIPEEIRNKVVVEPWKYRQTDEAKIIAALKKYGGRGKTPFMMGAGWNSTHYHGSYEATRIWCQNGAKYPNVAGVTICLWETNDLVGRIDGLFGGANYSWTPETPVRAEDDFLGENLRCLTSCKRRRWQTVFMDAHPDALKKDQGPEVDCGKYVWPPRRDKAAAPTADFNPRE